MLNVIYKKNTSSPANVKIQNLACNLLGLTALVLQMLNKITELTLHRRMLYNVLSTLSYEKDRCPYAASERDRFLSRGHKYCHENVAYPGNLITSKTQVEWSRKKKVISEWKNCTSSYLSSKEPEKYWLHCVSTYRGNWLCTTWQFQFWSIKMYIFL